MAHALDANLAGSPAAGASILSARPAYQAYRILHVGYLALPIIAGLDKFFDRLVAWDMYLAPAVPRLTGLSANTFMQIVGVVEVAAGVLVGLLPRYGAYVVALWLWGIIANLLLLGNFYDIALRDFGLSLGALALARLAADFRRSDRRPG